jgi:two-component system response regulator BaeR
MRDVSDRAIDSHIKNLRRKIQVVEPTFENIVSVYGVGYRFDPLLCA